MASPFTTQQFQTLQLELQPTKRGAILWLTLNRPKSYNSLNMEMISELHVVFDLLEHPTSMLQPVLVDHPRVVILQGAGSSFSAGVDIKAADRGIGGSSWDYLDARSQQLLSRLIEKMRRVPQPIVASVRGAAAGAGLALALASDVRVAARCASFSAAFVRLGLTGCDMGTSYYAWRTAGLGVASEMLLTGRPLGAERAFQVGLVNELASGGGEALRASALRMATDMLHCSRKGLQLGKEQLSAAADGGALRSALVAENAAQMLLVNDADSKRVAQRWLDAMLAPKQRRARL